MLGDFVILLKIVEKMCLVSYVFSFYLLVLLKFVKLTLFMFYRFFFTYENIWTKGIIWVTTCGPIWVIGSNEEIEFSTCGIEIN